MELRIKINDICKIQELCKYMTNKDFDMDIKRGRYCCSADSIMGLLSIGLNEGATATLINANLKDYEEFKNFASLLDILE